MRNKPISCHNVIFLDYIMTDKRNNIIEIAKKLFRRNGTLPSYNDLKEEGISNKAVRYHVGNLSNVHEEVLYPVSDENEVNQPDTITHSVVDNKDLIVSVYLQIAKEDGAVTKEKFKENNISEYKIRETFGGMNNLHTYMQEHHNVVLVKEDNKELITDTYIEIMKGKMGLPNHPDFINKGISRDKIRSAFGNITSLHDYMVENHSDEINKIAVSDNVIFSKRNTEKIKNIFNESKRFVITTAVSGKRVDKNLLASIRNYCSAKEAELVIIPCSDVWDRGGSNNQSNNWFFGNEISEDIFIFDDTRVNNNLMISSIKTSAKQIKPTTGLSRLTHNNGSIIMASPKQFLEYVPNKYSNIPNALMTTGAITIADYSTDKYMSERISYLAESDHIMGGLIVEVMNNEIFLVRQFQSDENGSFIDLGIQYNADNTTEKVSCDVVLGDWHTGETSPNSIKFVKEISETVTVDNFIVHDIFNGSSVNHHIAQKPLVQALNIEEGNMLIKDELYLCGEAIDFFQKYTKGNVVIVKSNHDEWLERYLGECRFAKDPANMRISLDLANEMMNGKDPFEYGVVKYGGGFDEDRVVFLQRNESYIKGGVELGNHADIGINGAKASAASMEYSFGNCVGAHSHSGLIFRGYWRAGTSTHLRLSYNKGASTWTNSHVLVYGNGARQMITMIGSDWKL